MLDIQDRPKEGFETNTSTTDIHYIHTLTYTTYVNYTHTLHAYTHTQRDKEVYSGRYSGRFSDKETKR